MKPEPIWKRQQLLKISWSALGEKIQYLSEQVGKRDDLPEVVIGISRGGLILAQCLAHTLDTKECYCIGIFRNTSETKYSQRGQPFFKWGLSADIVNNKSVIIADDIAGDGGTLKSAAEYLIELGAASVTTCVIVKNKGCRKDPDYFATEVDDWVVFPWELLNENEQTPVTTIA
ncbi:phosphoribosyltransferase [Gynuella sunshinyii]|uniref:Phosphoribosyl-pyrophosphate transferase n=2 Tax=Gynuella sunshinyii TaxID=1445505 RepID=A0A0M3L9C3_9GAMM|nr:phosphoribosyltransferase domain-containing protein [Gynuella sunshinyii]AII80611.1 phosphoribosyl-pyrophosphate transferase [Gynuella sunshinyii YC6258]AJQ93079.1 putative phosphoribosyltransferase [Gynuella sunshinyii YC6258]